MKRNHLSSALVGALILSWTVPAAQAAVYSNGTDTASFTVTLILAANCTINANPLNFGSNGVLGTAINMQSTVAGTVTGSTVTNRLMAGTTAGNTATTVGFQLYQDTGHTTTWGNTQGTNT